MVWGVVPKCHKLSHVRVLIVYQMCKDRFLSNVWKDFITNMLFKIVLTKNLLDFVNVRKGQSCYIGVKIILNFHFCQIIVYLSLEISKIFSSRQFSGGLFLVRNESLLMLIVLNSFAERLTNESALSLLSNLIHCWGLSLLQTFKMSLAVFEPLQNLEFRLCWLKLCSSGAMFTECCEIENHIIEFSD